MSRDFFNLRVPVGLVFPTLFCLAITLLLQRPNQKGHQPVPDVRATPQTPQAPNSKATSLSSPSRHRHYVPFVRRKVSLWFGHSDSPSPRRGVFQLPLFAWVASQASLPVSVEVTGVTVTSDWDTGTRPATPADRGSAIYRQNRGTPIRLCKSASPQAARSRPTQ